MTGPRSPADVGEQVVWLQRLWSSGSTDSLENSFARSPGPQLLLHVIQRADSTLRFLSGQKADTKMGKTKTVGFYKFSPSRNKMQNHAPATDHCTSQGCSAAAAVCWQRKCLARQRPAQGSSSGSSSCCCSYDQTGTAT